jgi:hypothetical protein
MEEVQKSNLGSVLGDAGCYLGNLAELAEELSAVAVEDDGSVIKIDEPQDVVKILQVLWNKFKETAQECEGKEITVSLPSTLIGGAVSAILGFLGFKL